MADTTTSSQPAFFKQLAANDKQARDAAVSSLRTYLTNRHQITPLELLKLWKGLFYCMWMSDKPRNQQQLARDLASLIHVLPAATVIPFLTAFWQTMANEWNGIDVLRMDKFLYLTRMYLLESLKWYKQQTWQGVEGYMDVLEQIPFNPTELRIPNGLRYHVIDIYVDELEKVEEHAESMPVETLLGPLRKLGKDSLTKSIRERTKIQLEDERIKKWLGEEEGEDGKERRVEQAEDDEWGGIED